MALIADGQQAIVDDVRAAIPRGIGQLTRDLAGLQRPAGVVHFASSDNASLWGGFIDGAIESGLREARRVAAELAQAG